MPASTRTVATSRKLTAADYLRAAQELVPLIEAEAAEAEQVRHQTDRTVAALRKADLYNMLMPRELGGSQIAYLDAMKAVEPVARADGSTGWCLMVGNVVACSLGAYLPDAGARRIYPHGPDTMAAGQGVPRGYARKVDGGYLVRGEWGYGSGIWHAEWGHCGCILMDGDKPVVNAEGQPEIVVIHVPRAELVLRDNWDVLGLRGTGSVDYTLRTPETFVPDDVCYSFTDVTPKRGGNQYSIGIVGFTSWGHTAWAIGLGRRILDELAALARDKANVFGRVWENVHFRHGYAEAESRYRAARAFCHEVWHEIDDTLAAGRQASVEQIALARMAMRHVHDVLSGIATFAHRAGGGASMRPSVLQRCYRDAHTGTQHILLSDQIFEECGRVLLGMTGPDAHWTPFGVAG